MSPFYGKGNQDSARIRSPLKIAELVRVWCQTLALSALSCYYAIWLLWKKAAHRRFSKHYLIWCSHLLSCWRYWWLTFTSESFPMTFSIGLGFFTPCLWHYSLTGTATSQDLGCRGYNAQLPSRLRQFRRAIPATKLPTNPSETSVASALTPLRPHSLINVVSQNTPQ